MSPEGLGLNAGDWYLKNSWLAWLPSEHGWSDHGAAMQALKHTIRSNFAQLVKQCKATSCAKPPRLEWVLKDKVFEDGEDRAMPWPNTTWTFDKGDQFTTIMIHKAYPKMAAMKEMSNHLGVVAHYVPKEGTPAGVSFVTPSIHADWAWYDSLDWFLTLTHDGGPPVQFWSWKAAAFVHAVVLMVLLSIWGCLQCLRRILRNTFKPCGAMLRLHLSDGLCTGQRGRAGYERVNTDTAIDINTSNAQV